MWYEKDIPIGAYMSEMLLADLMGDEKPEVIIPYILQKTVEEPTLGVLVGGYDDTTHDWSLVDDFRYDEKRLQINEIQPLGKMTAEGGKVVILLKEELVSVTTINTAVHVLRMAPDDKALLDSAEFIPDHLSPVSLQGNQLSFTEGGDPVTYKREEMGWLRGDGLTRKVYLKQAPSLYEEPFMQLLDNHPIMQARVVLEEGYEEAKNRLGTPQIEAYDLGGLCVQYDSFNFCNNGQENPIVHISLQVVPTYTIEEVKQYLGKPDEKQHWDIQDYYYVYNYDLGGLTSAIPLKQMTRTAGLMKL